MSKRMNFVCFVLTAFVLMAASPSDATQFLVGGKPLNVLGQISQSIAYGWHDDFDTYPGINSALIIAVIEGDYKPSSDFKLYGSLVMTGDLAYELRSGDKWEARGFQRSRADLEWDSDVFQVIKELHATWTPGNFMFRAGKQIVSWGEMIGFRLLDQINPLDSHRGIGDLEFENTILPVWMLRAEYNIPGSLGWLSDMNLQLLVDPRADKAIYALAASGNDQAGIWAPYIDIGGGILLGSTNLNLHHPNSWTDPNVGIRFQTRIKDGLASLNFLYGRDYNFLSTPTGLAGIEMFGAQQVAHLNANAYFPVHKLLGGMYAVELASLQGIVAGITAPMLRFEWSYAFQSAFVNTSSAAEEQHDDQRLAASLDFAVPIRFLNPGQTFKITMQYYLRRIAGIDDGFENSVNSTEGPANKYNHMTTLVLATSYLEGRLSPAVIWNQDWINKFYILKAALSYNFSSNIAFIAGLSWFEGSLTGKGVEVYDHKDYASFKVQYKFN